MSPTPCPKCGCMREIKSTTDSDLIIRCFECHTIKDAFPLPEANE